MNEEEKITEAQVQSLVSWFKEYAAGKLPADIHTASGLSPYVQSNIIAGKKSLRSDSINLLDLFHAKEVAKENKSPRQEESGASAPSTQSSINNLLARVLEAGTEITDFVAVEVVNREERDFQKKYGNKFQLTVEQIKLMLAHIQNS